MSELAGGRSIVVYGQQEVVKDLIQARVDICGEIIFDAEVISISDPDGSEPRMRFLHDGVEAELTADFVAGCDGFHGISRGVLPVGRVTVYEKEYPYAWLGILAAVPPSHEELIYVRHARGFALHSMRSPDITRLYLQVDPDDDVSAWSDDRIWSEIR